GVSGIASVSGYKMLDDKIIPTEGELRYRGIRLTDLVENYFKEDKFGYEETIYLLLSCSLPTKGEMAAFDELLEENRKLPHSFIENFIINSPSENVMNICSGYYWHYIPLMIRRNIVILKTKSPKSFPS